MSSLIQRAFAGGEISPQLYARCDEVKYATGLRTLRNFLIMRHGGVQNRPGTSFICEVAYSSNPLRLIPFEFNDQQVYVLEFGNLYVRIILDGQLVTNPNNSVTAITQAAMAQVTSAAHGYTNGTEVYLSNVRGMTQLNDRNFLVANATTNTFTLKYKDGTDVDSTTFGAFILSANVASIYQVVTPYVTADLPLLKFFQSADVLNLTHASYPPASLNRLGDADWTYAVTSFGPDISAPIATVTGGNTPVGGIQDVYVVTAVNGLTDNESPSSAPCANGNTAASAGSPMTVQWGGVANAIYYNIYKQIGGITGIYGFIGSSNTLQFIDSGITPDALDVALDNYALPFAVTGNYPSCGAYIQQRLCYGNQNSNTEKVFMSATGKFTNYTPHIPLLPSDPISFNLVGRKVNPVKHILDLGFMVIFTANGEFAINSNGEGAITPSNIVPKQQSFFGSSDLRPIPIGMNAIYVQARGSIVRDLGFEFQTQSYTGDDLTVFSPHLFDNFILTDWDYQQIPNSIIWIARDDGSVIGMTYNKEQQIWGWHRHDFPNGFVENVCSIPNGIEDSVYFVIRRTINGETKRYIEMLNTRTIDEVQDCIFMDSAITYDGRGDGTNTVTLSGGTTWEYNETITLTATKEYSFSTTGGVLPTGVDILDADGTLIRFTIISYVDGYTVTGRPNMTVPVEMRNVAFADYAFTMKTIGGLWNLEGQNVSVFADGYVVASPNNDAYPILTVTNGEITLPNNAGVVQVGIPFISDIETLDIDMANGPTISTYNKHIKQVALRLFESRGFFSGIIAPEEDPSNITVPPTSINPLTNLIESKMRHHETENEPIVLTNDVVKVNILSNSNNNGRVFVRNVDPIPLSVLSIVPSGDLPIKG